MQFFFIVCSSRGLRKRIETKVLTISFYFIKRFFKKQKRSGTSLCVSFSARFLKKIISHVRFYQLTKFQCLTVFTFSDIWQYVYCNCLGWLAFRIWDLANWNGLGSEKRDFWSVNLISGAWPNWWLNLLCCFIDAYRFAKFQFRVIYGTKCAVIEIIMLYLSKFFKGLFIFQFKAFSFLRFFKFFEGCLPQILLGSFLNTLSHI